MARFLTRLTVVAATGAAALAFALPAATAATAPAAHGGQSVSVADPGPWGHRHGGHGWHHGRGHGWHHGHGRGHGRHWGGGHGGWGHRR